jgi:hypothetical protein
MAYEPLSVATYYIALFAPRQDVYNVWTDKGWRPKRKPLTPEVVLAALSKKGPSVGAYMIAPGNVSSMLAFDFDTKDGWEQALQLGQTMLDLGLTAYVETSRRGAHLWSPIDALMPAKTIRKAARSLLESALHSQDPHIEIRPGSDTVEAIWEDGHVLGNGLGHPLRLPCMPHPKTGKFGKMHHPNGRPVGGSLAEVLLNIDQTPAALIEQRSTMWAPTISGLPKAYRKQQHTGPDPYEDASVCDILMRLWDVHNARPGKAVKCPAHDDKNPSLSILPDDKRAICKSPGCILNNNDHGRGTYELTTLAPV